MLIECTLKRDEPVIVPIGNEKYTFEKDEKGRSVAEVWIEDHIQAFLAVSHLYREVKDATPYDGMKRPALMNTLKVRNIKFPVTASNDELRALLVGTAA